MAHGEDDCVALSHADADDELHSDGEFEGLVEAEGDGEVVLEAIALPAFAPPAAQMMETPPLEPEDCAKPPGAPMANDAPTATD